MSVLLNINAQSAADLLSKLDKIDITVPPRRERSKEHRERFMMARMLATLVSTTEIQFPLRLEHRDKPDFALYTASSTIGIECIEAIPAEWATIQAIRDKDFPEAMISVPKISCSVRKFSTVERVEIARGDRASPPWMGNTAEVHWAEGIAHSIKQKTEKLRKGNYSEFEDLWLLVQDEWPAPVHSLEEYKEAANLCAKAILPYCIAPCFSKILIGNHRWLITLFPSPVTIQPINDLWKNY